MQVHLDRSRRLLRFLRRLIKRLLQKHQMFHSIALSGRQRIDGATKLRGPVRPVERLLGIVIGSCGNRTRHRGIRTKADAIVVPGPVTVKDREVIITAVARHGLPAVYAYRFFAVSGGFISYGVHLADLYKRTAGYVDSILNGAKPADLPVQNPTKFELVINLKTAKALGSPKCHTRCSPAPTK